MSALRADNARQVREAEKARARGEAAEAKVAALEAQLEKQQGAARAQMQQLRAKNHELEEALARKAQRDDEMSSNLNRRIRHLELEKDDVAALLDDERARTRAAEQRLAVAEDEGRERERELVQAREEAQEVANARSAAHDAEARASRSLL